MCWKISVSSVSSPFTHVDDRLYAAVFFFSFLNNPHNIVDSLRWRYFCKVTWLSFLLSYRPGLREMDRITGCCALLLVPAWAVHIWTGNHTRSVATMGFEVQSK